MGGGREGTGGIGDRGRGEERGRGGEEEEGGEEKEENVSPPLWIDSHSPTKAVQAVAEWSRHPARRLLLFPPLLSRKAQNPQPQHSRGSHLPLPPLPFIPLILPLSPIQPHP